MRRARPPWFAVALTAGLVGSGCVLVPRAERALAGDSAAAGEGGLLQLGNLAPSRMQSALKNAVGLGPDETLARQLAREGDALFRDAMQQQGDARRAAFASAGDRFAKAAARWPDSLVEEDSLYMAGESYFFADRYHQAAKIYEQLMKKYPQTRRIDVVDARRFELARYWLKLADTTASEWTPNFTDSQRPWLDSRGNALRVLRKIRLDDPTGKLADDATVAAANAQFLRGNYLQADELYADLRSAFPSSPHQFQAHLLGLKCKLMMYQGPSYDGKPLEQAAQILEQIRRQFPDEAKREVEYLTNAAKEIRLHKALREWELARYFDRRSEYAAARQHYQAVIQQYADTSLAPPATQRLAELGGLPDRSPPSLPWLTSLFPHNKQDPPLVATTPADTQQR